MSCDQFMRLDLVKLPYRRIPGIYGANKTQFAKRLAFMHPVCATSFLIMQEECSWNIVLSDAWRASLSSLHRKFPPGKPVRRGTQRPGYSGHNYGFSIDIAVTKTMRRMGFKRKRDLDEYMIEHYFFCHRQDHRRDREEWHYNSLVLGIGPQKWLRYAGRSTAGAVEAMIRAVYGTYWKPSKRQLQRNLKYVKLYHGEIDGKIGPLSNTAVRVFQGAWRLKADGVAGPRTCRTLAFRCAELRNPLIKSLWSVRG